MNWSRLGVAFVLVFAGAIASAESTSAPQSTAIAAHGVVPIWPGVAPGSEGAQQTEKTSPFPSGKFSVVRNVVQPTLTVYLPADGLATGTGVIVAPGGAFRFLTMDAEGHDAARWLAAHGIAAFVLKYRLVATAADDLQMWQDVMRLMTAGSSVTTAMDQDGRLAVADGMQAMKVVRAHAKQWGVAPNRIGFMGFSAGAMVASNTLLLSEPADRPNFVAPIYGAPFGALPTIPGNLPPVFLAYAADDNVVSAPIEAFYKALRTAGHRPELHVYAKGGHGFGMNKQGTSSDYWIEDFHHWLGALGLAGPPGG
jgi:acetyl esterase/lipase